MAACGASDSVITQTPVVSRELQVPLLLFTISLHGGFCSTGSCFYSQHNITHSALPQSPEDCSGADTGRPNVMRLERNGGRGARRNLSFHFDWERWCSPSGEQERGDLFISICHALIYSSYIYPHTHTHTHTHTAVSFWKRKNIYLWRLDCNIFLSLPFMVSAKHNGLKWGEKSDDHHVLHI